MNNRFCASCGNANPYTAVKPTVCDKCRKPFEAAFAIIAPAVTFNQAPALQQPYRPAQSNRRFTPARGRNSPAPYTPEPEDHRPHTNDPDDYFDPNEVSDAAQALAATINASDFMLGTEDGGNHHGRLSPNPHQQVSNPRIRRKKN